MTLAKKSKLLIKTKIYRNPMPRPVLGSISTAMRKLI
jgi:hypothetical protein